ncbi:hypothetical protein K0B04_03705, partial [Patescibacteria group bacterium]|nr:hypothetical protein [Patescibacteria group bacterium]
MKRYLNKRKLKKILVIALFTGLFLPSLTTIAQGKQDYYRKLFGKEFEFTIYESDKEKAKDEDYLSSNLKKGYAVVLTSSIFDENTVEEDEEEVKSDDIINYFEPYKKVILICDNDFSAEYPFEFSCDYREVFSKEAINLGKFLRSIGDRDIDLYVIPENILLSPDSRSNIGKYFSAIKRSDEAPEVSEDAKLEEEERSILSDLKDFKDTMVFEFFSISFSMFIIASLSWGLLRFLTKEDKNFDIEFFKNLSNSFKKLHLYQKILIPVLVGMVLIYIPLV